MIGRTLTHYRIESKLGEGGMGVVYKALDTHLDRPVAVKVLPAEAVANPERKKRFVQEAKTASALNHPNIIHVYDIDTADGVDFIAMEFVPGKTLDQVIGRKGMDLSSGLKYAVQIGDALATAHAAGIVHRDLKPGNIMVTESGLVKVLDFGLAKLTERTENELSAFTQTMDAPPRTEEGTIVGTVAYMSPEQAQGKKVDARSDIFALGCVLHEMVTGRRAFQGETKMQTLAAILNQEPQAVSQLVEGAPRDLEKIIARCLRKDPERRFQTAADLRVALQELKEESESGKLAALPGATRRPRFSAVIVGLVIVWIVGAGVLGWWLRRPEKPRPGPVSIRLTADAGLTTDPTVSPNGTLLAYASDRGEEGNLDLWVKQLPNGEPVQITRHVADDRAPVFSPDGAQIAFDSDRDGGGVYVVPALGGAERLIARPGGRPRYSPDGKWIAYQVGFGPVPLKIHIVPAAGGTPRLWRPEFSLSYNAVWSPDSKHLIFLGTKDSEGTDWWVAPLEAGPAVRTGLDRAAGDQGLSDVTVNQWMAEGNQILLSAQLSDSTNIWRASISPGTWQVASPFTRLTFGNGTEVQPSRAGAGAVVYVALAATVDIWSLPIDANQGKVTGEPKPVTQDATPDDWPTLSADGKKLAFLSFRSGNADVWIKDLESGKEGALTATPAREMTPEISFDGAKVAFAVTENRKVAIYMVAASGGAPEKVCEECANLYHSSPDGKLVFGVSDRKNLWVLDPATRQKTLFVASQDHLVVQARFSSDGRWMSFVEALGPSRAREVIVPFRGGQAPDRSEWIAVTDGATNDLVNWWSPDGNLLYFRSDRDGFACFWAQRLDPGTKQPRGATFPVYHSHRARRRLAAPDGPTKISIAPGKLVFPVREETGNIWMAKLDGMP